tara:strand:+ start:556 stop:837 length:282 start_codon:yes stop_codon:yes gene_type:complete
MKLAVVIDVDGDIMYVPEGKVFPNFPSPKVFNNIADAEEERDKWNTGIIVDLDDNNKTVPTIRSFDDEERRRAKEREEMNRDDGTSTGQDSTQ